MLHKFWHKRALLLLIVALISTLISGCDVLGDILTGLSGLCERDPLLVTKTMDTDDGLCTGADCSLREAVITSNVCEGRQHIQIPAGTYPLSLEGAGEDEAHTGDLDILDTVRIEGTGGEVVIDGRGIDRVFHIIDPREVPDTNTLSGLTITGGSANDMGGGIYHQAGWLNLEDSLLRDNEAGSGTRVGGAGGGLFSQAHFTNENLTIENNVAHGSGGGAYFDEGSYTLVNGGLLVQRNQSLGGEGGGGFFFFQGSVADMNDARFVENETAANGGGIWNDGELEIRRTRFESNVSGSNGGGVFNGSEEGLVLRETWFTNNNAEQGGGLFNQGAVHFFQSGINNNTAFAGLGGGLFNEGGGALMQIRNSTISANMIPAEHEGGGGGIINNGGDVQIAFSTLAYNSINGVFNRSGQVQMESTVLGHHTRDNCVGNTVDSEGHNLEDGSSCDFTESSDVEVDRVGIDRLAMNGGFSLTHALLADSPALDSGGRDACLPVDQRGVSRPQGERCDRGAFESEEYGGDGSGTMGATALPPETPTATPAPTRTPTPTISVTPTLQGPTGELDQNAFCRTGPGTVYPPATAYEAGTTLVIDGQNNFDPRWWRVVVPSTGGHCWISDSLLSTTGAVEEVPEYQAPPTPTPTPVPPTVTPTYQGQTP